MQVPIQTAPYSQGATPGIPYQAQPAESGGYSAFPSSNPAYESPGRYTQQPVSQYPGSGLEPAQPSSSPGPTSQPPVQRPGVQVPIHAVFYSQGATPWIPYQAQQVESGGYSAFPSSNPAYGSPGRYTQQPVSQYPGPALEPVQPSSSPDPTSQPTVQRPSTDENVLNQPALESVSETPRPEPDNDPERPEMVPSPDASPRPQDTIYDPISDPRPQRQDSGQTAPSTTPIPRLPSPSQRWSQDYGGTLYDPYHPPPPPDTVYELPYPMDLPPFPNRSPGFWSRVGDVLRWPFTSWKRDTYPVEPYPLSTDSDGYQVVFTFVARTLPSQVYLHLLLRLPSLYFSRVARIFEEADLTLPEIKKMALETASRGKGNEFDIHSIEHSNVPLQYERLKSTWESFIDSLMREWKTFNIISVLLLSAILTILQIQSAAADPVTRYAAIFSLICALVSLLFGCMYIIRFGSMRKTYKAAEWALEAKKTKTVIWWNVWVLLAMPAIWLTWSIILYIAASCRSSGEQAPMTMGRRKIFQIGLF
ncbi:hypothetical protein BDZ97DRAFT_832381 [Flammula alnicola]|nr:hypothetical protein BDZ97DRAFT_832381 [Flammula alnicola]